jgi:deoxyhypusine monooxygenase
MQLDTRIQLLLEMEKRFDMHDEIFFEKLLKHEDYIIRTRAVCILADIAGEKAVELIGDVLLNDPDHLVRHEAAFSLGQMGYTSGISILSKAVLSDPSFFVRHEAAIALGVIGSEESKSVLNQSLNDRSEEVRESALVALANIDYVSYVKRNNKFTKMTGG